jgi:hypothetical protein
MNRFSLGAAALCGLGLTALAMWDHPAVAPVAPALAAPVRTVPPPVHRAVVTPTSSDLGESPSVRESQEHRVAEVARAATVGDEEADQVDRLYAGVERLDEQVETEVPDAAWRTITEARAREALARNNLVGVDIAEVDCGASLCRMSVAFAQAQAREGFVQHFEEFLEQGSEGFAHLEGEDDDRIQVYLARAEGRLPQVW